MFLHVLMGVSVLHVVKTSLKILKGNQIPRKGHYNGRKKKKDKRTNNNLQNITQKTKDRATRTPLKPGGELRCTERVNNFCSTCDTRRVTLTNPVISHLRQRYS